MMNYHDPHFWWFVFGVFLMVLEFFVPGLISVFLGIAAVGVGFSMYLGWVDSFTQAFTLWFALSIFLVLTLRQLAAKFLPAEVDVVHTDDDVEAIGQIVQVISDVSPDNHEGRIRYMGTSWPARSEFGVIPAGKKAVLRYRENIAWVVAPAEPEESDKD
ncbi:MAG: NfeD family protein [Candidatus Hydrogenedentota bacterium]|nr:MAG: NfeD family protein [Candidatus Hydrogenedentota bacterium]